jgi:hypothetical protein
VDIHRIYAAIQPIFRRRRMRRFVATLNPAPDTRILDVGGYPREWENAPFKADITITNIHRPDLSEAELARWNFVVADGRSLPFADSSFDIAFSNSVIEHLSTHASQQAFAREIRRVARRLWVQTPAKSFPIEPHLLTPFVHYLPRHVRRKLLRFTVWGLVTKPTPDDCDAFLDEVRLLTHREMRALFPDCVIMRERVLFWTKSYIAVR